MILSPNFTLEFNGEHSYEGVGRLGSYTWFNPPKTGLLSRTFCGTVCALSIAIVLC